MPTAWTPYTAGQVLSAPGPGPVIEQLQTSAYERLRAAFGDSWAATSGNVPYPMPAPGNPFLRAGFWTANGPGYILHRVGIDSALFGTGYAFSSPGVPYSIVSALECFVDHRVAVEGSATPPPFWTLPTIRDAAGLPLTRFYSWSGSGSPTETIPLRGGLMKRVRYRTIVTTGASADEQGNAAVAGQRAFLQGDGRRYRCVASGNWTRDESAQADLIDNTQAPPNTVCESLPGYPTTGLGGPILGDVAGLWLYEERRLVMDLMRWTVLELRPLFEAIPPAPRVLATALTVRQFEVTGEVDTATAYADAATGFPGATPVAGPGSGGGAGVAAASCYLTDGGVGNCLCILERDAADFEPLNAISAIPKKWTFFALGAPWTDGTHTGPFDANGDAIQNGTYHAWANSAGPDAATLPVKTWAAGRFAIPPNTSPTPGAGNNTVSGYQVEDALLLCKWNVTGGLSFCSVTD